MININISNITALSSATITSLVPTACCWGPAVLTSVAGFSGVATHFSWVHPLKPYLFGLAFISLAFSFYQAYKPEKTKDDSCPNCEIVRSGLKRSKLYVWVVAAFVIMMYLLNYFPHLFLK